MIYIVRHQEGDAFSNCLNLDGMYRVQHIASVLKSSFENTPLKCIHTCRPLEFKHMRPVQTATMLCTYLTDERFSVFAHVSYDGVLRDLSKIVDIDRYDVVIVWHRGEIMKLVDVLCDYYDVPKSLINGFYWPDNNYDGCVLVDTEEKDTGFIHNFFQIKKRKNLFFLNCLKLF